MGASSQRALEEQLAEERLRDAAPNLLEALKWARTMIPRKFHEAKIIDEIIADAEGKS
jgi:hypothetical protein